MSALRVAILALISLALVGPAAAGGRVDWSEYIDRTPQKPIAVQPVAGHKAPARSKTTKVSRAKKKAAKSKAAAKARNKKKTRRK